MADSIYYVDMSVTTTGNSGLDPSLPIGFNEMTAQTSAGGSLPSTDRRIYNLRGIAVSQGGVFVSSWTGTGTMIFQQWEGEERAVFSFTSGGLGIIPFFNDEGMTVVIDKIRIDIAGSATTTTPISASSPQNMTVTNCIFNRAGGTDGTFHFVVGIGTFGAGASALIVDSCTFCDSQQDIFAKRLVGVSCSDPNTTVTIKNSIFQDCQGISSVSSSSGYILSDCVVTNSDTPYQEDGIGNLPDSVTNLIQVGGDAVAASVHNQFVNPVEGASGNFHLLSSSLAIETGNTDLEQDYDFVNRPFIRLGVSTGDNTMGAYTYIPPPVPRDLIIKGTFIPKPAFPPGSDPTTTDRRLEAFARRVKRINNR